MSNLFATFARKIFPAEKKVYSTRQTELDKIAPGFPDPCTQNTIKEVVMQAEGFIVTIDDELSINWMANNLYTDYAKDFSSVTSKVQLLSMQINRLFTNRGDRYRYKRIVAESLGLVLSEKKSGNALALLKEAEYRITAQGKERARMAYVYGSFFTALFIGVLLCITVQYKNTNWLFGGDVNRYQIAIATLLGGIGSFVSTFVRFKNYEASTNSGLSIHRLDGFLRVLYGCIAALIFTLAIYSNTILGFLNSAAIAQPWVVYFFAAMAGATEFLVPNLINKNMMEPLFRKTFDEETNSAVTEKTITFYKNGKESGEETRNGEKQREPLRKIEEEPEKNGGYFVQGKINLRD